MAELTQQALTYAEVQDMRALEPSKRNRLLLRLLYWPFSLRTLCPELGRSGGERRRWRPPYYRWQRGSAPLCTARDPRLG